ncbi:hypothetical protein [Acidobacterium sp. S8]|uniref:hypothetical protein n=1 Tax=Acidobacterium sp. S8 TaxID=1641854 RepID=UPI00131CC65F|nr:hypothetical protein [Acidobacterium sp. S8]
MKKTGVFIACSVALTLLFYLLADYLLPPPPPSAPMMLLFAGIAMVLVWLAQCCVRANGNKKDNAHTKLVIVGVLAGLALSLSACNSAPRETAAPAPAQSAPPPPPPALSIAPIHSVKMAMPMPRVTGTALLASSQKEENGYGLYSYVLLSHSPSDADMPKYKAFFKALLIDLPEASAVARYVSKARINITYIPVTTVPAGWEQLAVEKRVDSIMANYDYGRGAVMLASLSKGTGQGPLIASLLQPLDVSAHPHPVLVQDLSTAQAALMDSYIAEFKNQAAQDRFWQPDTLQQFALSLRNLLETAATGLGMSQTAVKSWVEYFK